MRHESAYKSVSKVDLRMSSINSDLLLEEDEVKKALKMTDKTASISFQQVVAGALVQLRSSLSIPLLEWGSYIIRLIGLTRPFIILPRRHRKGQHNRIQDQVLPLPQEDYGQFFSQVNQWTTADRIARCLACNQDGWMNIGTEDWVLSLLKEGYKIPCSTLPHQNLFLRHILQIPKSARHCT